MALYGLFGARAEKGAQYGASRTRCQRAPPRDGAAAHARTDKPHSASLGALGRGQNSGDSFEQALGHRFGAPLTRDVHDALVWGEPFGARVGAAEPLLDR